MPRRPGIISRPIIRPLPPSPGSPDLPPDTPPSEGSSGEGFKDLDCVVQTRTRTFAMRIERQSHPSFFIPQAERPCDFAPSSERDCACVDEDDDGGGEDNPLCPGLTGPAVFDFGDLEYFDDGVAQVSPCQVVYDPADFPGLTSIRIRGSIAIEDVAYETPVALSLVDENGVVYWTATGLVYTPNPDDTYYSRAFFDDVVVLSTTTAHTYHLKWSKESAAGGGFQVLNPQLWIFFTASDQAKFQLPIMRGLFLDGIGIYQDSAIGAVEGVYNKMSGQIQAAIVPVGVGAFSEVDYRELYVVADSYTYAGGVAVYDITAGAIIAGTEIAIAEGAADGVTFAVYTLQIPESLFPAGHDISIWGKHDVFHRGLSLVSADLNVKVGSPAIGYFTSASLCAEAAEVYVRDGIDDCEVVWNNTAYLHKSAYWPASTIFYFEGTDHNAVYNTLIDAGTVTVENLAAVVTVQFAGGAAYSRQRSASVSLTNLHLYGAGRDAVAETINPDADTKTFIVGVISGP